MKTWVWIIIASSFLISCTSKPPVTAKKRNEILNEMVKERAAFEMQCPFPQLRVTRRDKGYAYAVKGCSQQLTYTVNPDCQVGLSEDQIRRSCYFSLNIDTLPTGDQGGSQVR